MAHSSHSKGSVSVDLFNLPTLPDERRVTTSYLDIPVNFYLVFSLNNQDIGCTQLVTMHVDTGDSPPICQKPYTLPLKHYSWVQQEIETLE